MTFGFPISDKENEKRRAVLPVDLKKYPLLCKQCYIEKGYGLVLGIDDNDFLNIGCHICEQNQVLECDVIVDTKIGDSSYLNKIKHKIVFGWIHATQNKDITDIIIKNKITAYAWEKMYEMNRHVFWKNNELAGEAAIINAIQSYGKLVQGLHVAVIGNGNTARGALKALNMLGAYVTQYIKKTELCLKMELYKYDIIVNCVLWDLNRKDHLISKNDLKKMKKGAMIVDVSCDRHGGVETTIPTTIENPTYLVDGILHYAVDHTPSIFYKTFTENNSPIVLKYLYEFYTNKLSDTLKKSCIIKDGIIIDEEILKYQNLMQL